MRRFVVLTILALSFCLSLVAQSCYDFNGRYNYTFANLVTNAYRHTANFHAFYDLGTVTCNYQGGGSYTPCYGYGNLVVSASASDVGPVNSPTIRGGYPNATHRTTASNSAAGSDYGNRTLVMSAAAGVSVEECAAADGSCAGGAWTWYGVAPSYKPQLGYSGTVLWSPYRVESASCPSITVPPPTPLVLPLKGGHYPNGTFTSFKDGVKFAFFQPGQPIQISWIAQDSSHRMDEPGDSYGFLVLPSGESAVPLITSSRMMFGSLTWQPQKTYPEGFAPNAFYALGEYDKEEYGGNANGVFDSGDDAYYRVRVWVDDPHTGVSLHGHLYTLGELGITEIGLKYRPNPTVDQFGNALNLCGYMLQRGQRVEVCDVIFVTK